MAWIIAAISAPFLLLLSFPLAFFAIATTTFAFWILLIRVLTVYAELFGVLLRIYIVPSTMRQADVPPPSPAQRSPQYKRQSRSSSVGSEALMTAREKSQSSANLATTTPLRDYEGVGGWRLQEDDEEEALWIGINSRLELPAAQMRRHQRSLTGSRLSSGVVSPELVRTPLTIRTTGRGMRGARSGAASPEGYFNMPPTGMTNLDRGSKVSFGDHRKSGSSSTTSLGSMKLTRQD